MNGYVNLQNRGTSENTTQGLPGRFWAGSVMGLYFFGNDFGEAFTLNGECYRTMIINIVAESESWRRMVSASPAFTNPPAQRGEYR